MGQVDHQFTKQLLTEVDEIGVGLSRDDIDFVADLIDGNVNEFSFEQAKRVRSLHDRRVLDTDADFDLD